MAVQYLALLFEVLNLVKVIDSKTLDFGKRQATFHLYNVCKQDLFDPTTMYRRKAIQLDAMRFAKSTQVKLDEINYRIEQDKKRILMLNRFEKIKVWNELREIRRVFVPRYIPGETIPPEEEGQDCTSKKESCKTSVSTQSDPTSNSLNNNVPKSRNRYEKGKLQKGQHLTIDEDSDLNSNLRVRKHKNTATRERKISPTSTRIKTHEPVSKPSSSSTSEKDLKQDELAPSSVSRWRKISWDVSNLRKISEEDNCPRKRSGSSPPAVMTDDTCPSRLVVPDVYSSASSSTSESATPRSHSSLGQNGIKSPSNSMLSVACGYMSFKKLLRNKRQTETFVSPRFRKQSEGDETIASNSAFLRSKSAVVKPATTANATRQRAARSNGVENATEEETATSVNNNSKKLSRRLSESSLLSAPEREPRMRKLSAGAQVINKSLVQSSKRFRGSKVRIDERNLSTSTSKLQLHDEGGWREECKSIKKTAAWTANDAHTMKSLTS